MNWYKNICYFSFKIAIYLTLKFFYTIINYLWIFLYQNEHGIIIKYNILLKFL